jgi:hypothetical protein
LIVRIDASRDRLIVTKNGVAKIISIQQEDGNGLDEIKETIPLPEKTIRI